MPIYLSEEEKYEKLNFYMRNNANKLNKMVRNCLIKYGGVPDFCMDDFYSLSGEELWKCLESYDKDKCNKFDNYLKVCIENKIKQQLTYMHRSKRCQKYELVDENGDTYTEFVSEARLDEVISDNDGDCFVDTIASTNNVENIVFSSNKYGEESFLDKLRLSKTQRKVAELLIDGLSKSEIIEKLNIDENKYNIAYRKIKSKYMY